MIVWYVFHLDDLADDDRLPVEDRVRRLQRERRRLREAIAARGAEDALLDVIVRALAALGLTERFDAQFESLASDLRSPTFATFADWQAKEAPFASIFAAAVAAIFEIDDPAARPGLEDLAFALLVNDVVCDVAEDLARGRTGIPTADFERFGVDPDVRRPTPEWRALLRHEIERARALLAKGGEAVKRAPRPAQRRLRAGLAVYEERLAALERHEYDVFSNRAKPSRARQVAVAVAAMLPTRGHERARAGPPRT